MAMNGFNFYLTVVEKEGPYIKLWAQVDRSTVDYIDNHLVTLNQQFTKGEGKPHVSTISVGMMCCAQFHGIFYRARVVSVANISVGLVVVRFVDYGNSTVSSVDDLRLVDEQLARLPPQATDFYLHGVSPLTGPDLDDVTTEYMRHHWVYKEFDAFLVVEANDKRLVKLYQGGVNVSDIMISQKLALVMDHQQQEALLTGRVNHPALHSSVAQPQQWQVPSHVPSAQFPVKTSSLRNAVYDVHGVPPGAGRASPLMYGVPQHMVPSSGELSAKTFTSPILEPNSEHNIFVSNVEDGPLSFAVQLQAAEQTLIAVTADIAGHRPIPLREPPVPGSVCLARFPGDTKLSRATIMEVMDSTCRVYYVDFGNVSDVPYTDIFELPAKLINPKAMALRFCLAGLKKGPPPTNITKEAFKDVVRGCLLRLRVAPSPEGPPLKQYGYLFREGRDVRVLYEELVKERSRSIANVSAAVSYPRAPITYEPAKADAVKNGTWVTISHLNSPDEFWVQLESDQSDLEQVMALLDEFCNRSKGIPSVSDLRVQSPVFARFSEDDRWYRASIIKVKSGNDGLAVHVEFVDYGNEEGVSDISRLRVAEPSIVSALAAQAIRCRLNGAANVRCKVGAEIWDQISVKFTDLTLESRGMVKLGPRGVGDPVVVIDELRDDSLSPPVVITMDALYNAVVGVVIDSPPEVNTAVVYSDPSSGGWQESKVVKDYNANPSSGHGDYSGHSRAYDSRKGREDSESGSWDAGSRQHNGKGRMVAGRNGNQEFGNWDGDRGASQKESGGTSPPYKGSRNAHQGSGDTWDNNKDAEGYSRGGRGGRRQQDSHGWDSGRHSDSDGGEGFHGERGSRRGGRGGDGGFRGGRQGGRGGGYGGRSPRREDGDWDHKDTSGQSDGEGSTGGRGGFRGGRGGRSWGGDGGDRGGRSWGGDGGDRGGRSWGGDGGDRGGRSWGGDGGDRGGRSWGGDGSDRGGRSWGGDGGDRGGRSWGGDGGDRGGRSWGGDGGDRGFRGGQRGGRGGGREDSFKKDDEGRGFGGYRGGRNRDGGDWEGGGRSGRGGRSDGGGRDHKFGAEGDDENSFGGGGGYRGGRSRDGGERPRRFGNDREGGFGDFRGGQGGRGGGRDSGFGGSWKDSNSNDTNGKDNVQNTFSSVAESDEVWEDDGPSAAPMVAAEPEATATTTTVPSGQIELQSVEVGSSEAVSVVFVESRANFFVQLQSQADKLDTITTLLSENYAIPDAAAEEKVATVTEEGAPSSEGVDVAPKITLSELNVGMECAALYSEGGWYRARVMSEPTEEGMTVKFVDFGNSEVVPEGNLRKLPSELCSLPAQAICCSLVGLPESGGENEEELDVDFETEVTSAEAAYTVTFVTKSLTGEDECIQVVLRNKDTGECVNLRFGGLEESSSAGSDAGNNTSSQEIGSIPKPDIDIGGTIDVEIVYVASRKEFYCQPQSSADQLSALMDKLASICVPDGDEGCDVGVVTEMKASKAAQISISSLEPGMPCAALFAEDGLWYRAVVDSEPAEEGLSVKFVDYGNKGEVAEGSLRELPAEMRVLPAQAICCCLVGVNEDSPEDGEVMDVDFEATVTSGEISYTATFVKRLLTDQNECMEILLKNKDTGECVNSQFGASDEVTDTVSDSLNQNCSEIAGIPKPELEIGSTMDVEIVYVASRREFYCQPKESAEELQAVMSKLAEMCTVEEEEVAPPCESTLRMFGLRPGMFCAALYAEDSIWYRAQVLDEPKVTETGSGFVVNVKFIDFGNEAEVEESGIKELIPALTAFPAQAIPCALLGLRDSFVLDSEKEIEFETTVSDPEVSLEALFVEKASESDHMEILLRYAGTQDSINQQFGAIGEVIGGNGFGLRAGMPAGLTLDVSVIWFVSPSRFYVQPLDWAKELVPYMESLQKVQKRSIFPWPPEVGTPVLARFAQDGGLYRAVVEDVGANSTVRVQYVDYGNRESLAQSQVWAADPCFKVKCPQAIPCTLNGISPIDGGWPLPGSPESSLDKYFSLEKCTCIFHGRVADESKVADGVDGESRLWVSLLKPDGTSVADELVEAGLAISDESMAFLPASLCPNSEEVPETQCEESNALASNTSQELALTSNEAFTEPEVPSEICSPEEQEKEPMDEGVEENVVEEKYVPEASSGDDEMGVSSIPTLEPEETGLHEEEVEDKGVEENVVEEKYVPEERSGDDEMGVNSIPTLEPKETGLHEEEVEESMHRIEEKDISEDLVEHEGKVDIVAPVVPMKTSSPKRLTNEDIDEDQRGKIQNIEHAEKVDSTRVEGSLDSTKASEVLGLEKSCTELLLEDNAKDNSSVQKEGETSTSVLKDEERSDYESEERESSKVSECESGIMEIENQDIVKPVSAVVNLDSTCQETDLVEQRLGNVKFGSVVEKLSEIPVAVISGEAEPSIDVELVVEKLGDMHMDILRQQAAGDKLDSVTGLQSGESELVGVSGSEVSRFIKDAAINEENSLLQSLENGPESLDFVMDELMVSSDVGEPLSLEVGIESSATDMSSADNKGALDESETFEDAEDTTTSELAKDVLKSSVDGDKDAAARVQQVVEKYYQETAKPLPIDKIQIGGDYFVQSPADIGEVVPVKMLDLSGTFGAVVEFKDGFVDEVPVDKIYECPPDMAVLPSPDASPFTSLTVVGDGLDSASGNPAVNSVDEPHIKSEAVDAKVETEKISEPEKSSVN